MTSKEEMERPNGQHNRVAEILGCTVPISNTNARSLSRNPREISLPNRTYNLTKMHPGQMRTCGEIKVDHIMSKPLLKVLFRILRKFKKFRTKKTIRKKTQTKALNNHKKEEA